MQILTSWGIKEGLGRVKGGSSSDFSSFRVSGADHLLFLVAGGLLGSVLVSKGAAGNPILSGNFSSPFSANICALPWLIPFSCSAYLCLLPARLSFFECFSKILAESMGWPFLIEPFFRFLSVSDMQTSPTESLEHGKSKSWLVLSGQQDDQPCPNTKKGYSTKTSTLTCRKRGDNRERQREREERAWDDLCARAWQAPLAAVEWDEAKIAKVLFSFCNTSTLTSSLHTYPCHTSANAFSELSISCHKASVRIKLYLYPAAPRGVKGKRASACG